MKTINIFIIFIFVALCQIFIPAKMILKQESILKTGVAFKFKTTPIDPNDPFRGKYINLNYEIDSYITKDSLWANHQPVYVYLTKDSLGFAKIDTVSKTILEDMHSEFVKAKVQWYNKRLNTLNIEFPYNRYYMEETKAYDAEVLVSERQRDTLPNDTYALIYVKNGEGVLEDVLVNEISIKDYVEKKD